MRCRRCNKNCGHWCSNCGIDGEMYPLSEGYCSNECLKADGGKTWDELVEDEEPVAAE